MKILVPEYVKNHNLTDQELVFANLMLYLMKRFGRKMRFYFHAEDVKRVLGLIKQTDNFGVRPIEISSADYIDNYLGNIRKSFHIGIINYYTWIVETHNCPNEYMYDNGQLKVCEITIKDQKAIQMYYYLVGRIAGDDIIMKDEKAKIWDTGGAFQGVLAPFFRDYMTI